MITVYKDPETTIMETALTQVHVVRDSEGNWVIPVRFFDFIRDQTFKGEMPLELIIQLSIRISLFDKTNAVYSYIIEGEETKQ